MQHTRRRNRYDSARARIHGFLTDFLRLDKPDWRAQLSKKPTLLMDAKHLGYKQEGACGDTMPSNHTASPTAALTHFP